MIRTQSKQEEYGLECVWSTFQIGTVEWTRRHRICFFSNLNSVTNSLIFVTLVLLQSSLSEERTKRRIENMFHLCCNIDRLVMAAWGGFWERLGSLGKGWVGADDCPGGACADRHTRVCRYMYLICWLILVQNPFAFTLCIRGYICLGYRVEVFFFKIKCLILIIIYILWWILYENLHRKTHHIPQILTWIIIHPIVSSSSKSPMDLGVMARSQHSKAMGCRTVNWTFKL